MIILVDTRQKSDKHILKHRYLERQGHVLKMCKLPFGDYACYDELPDEMKTRIDRIDRIYRERREFTNREKLERSELSKDLEKVIKHSVDTKQDLNEVCTNLCARDDKSRFWREVRLARGHKAKLTILCEHGGKIEGIQDVAGWENKHGMVSGRQLMEEIYSCHISYGVDFLFCNKWHTGQKIIELLGGG